MVSGTGKQFTRASLGLSFVAGVGFVAMMIALGIGMIQGAAADSGTIGLLFAGGLVLFIVGAAGWFAVEQPHKHFDDINVPHYHGHHDEHHDIHEAHTDEHAGASHSAH